MNASLSSSTVGSAAVEDAGDACAAPTVLAVLPQPISLDPAFLLVGVIGATPGPAGTRLSQTAWLPVLRQLGTQPWFGKSLFLANAGQAFDASGTLTDAKMQQLLRDYLAGFAAFVTAHSTR